MKLMFAVLLISIGNAYSQMNVNYPPTEKVSFEYNLHGNKIIDNYQWLEDKTNPKVRKWSEEQHKFTIDYINKNGDEIVGLKNELRSYFDRDYRSAPFFVEKRQFFYSKKRGQQHNVLFTIIDGKEIKLFDPMDIDSSGKSSWNGVDFTEKGDKVAIGLQYKGNEIAEFRIVDTQNGKVIGNSIKELRDFKWAKDEKYAYITVRTKEMIDNQKPLPIYKHKLNTDRKEDKLMFVAKDAKNWSVVWDDNESDFTFYSDGDFYSRSIMIQKQNSKDKPKQIFDSKEYNAEPAIHDGKLFIFTNEKAPNFKIMVTELNNPDFKNWKPFISEKKDAVLESYIFTSDFCITSEKKDVMTKLFCYDLNGKFKNEIALPEFGDVSSVSFNKTLNVAFVSINTFTSPSKLYKLDGKTLKWELLYQEKSPINTENITSKLVFYPSKDGTKIPMFLIHKKDLQLNENNPTLLYGYGGFNVSMQPSYLGEIASIINRGGVYAVACLRGGNEYGENWHKMGMLDKKQNVFDDFATAAEYLIKEKYTNPNKLAISGRSNGGLLVGATITQRPELFKAAICGVALLDMLRYHKFLIARYWIPEYGNADLDKDYSFISKYSPYQNIKSNVKYPAILITAGENDSRVDALHAKKFAASLQSLPNQKAPALLFVDFDAGHGSGGSGQSVEKRIENKYLELKFLLNNLEIK